MRVFEIVTPSADDLTRARRLPLAACPRRYCWWWQTLGFDWDTPVAIGCTFLRSRKPADWPHPEFPCRRCNPVSEVDHYESREPHLLDDGFAVNRFLVDDAGFQPSPEQA